MISLLNVKVSEANYITESPATLRLDLLYLSAGLCFDFCKTMTRWALPANFDQTKTGFGFFLFDKASLIPISKEQRFLFHFPLSGKGTAF